ncbi:Receptor protein serine/threonine kinase [Aphelenchoides bicaudatus]|nr:Receptor protein serine/threonine kinase [Aphelenchoides bicaudatus]
MERSIWLLFFFGAAIVTIISGSLLSQKQINHTANVILHIIKTHEKYLEYPLVENEIFCRCTVDGCDEELVHIGGEPVRGMCRARGGMCRQAVKIGEDGHVEHAVLDCIHPEYLNPPNRPFICQAVKNNKSRDYVICCNDQSFCNDLDVPVAKPKSLVKAEERTSNWPWFVVLLIIVAALFSGIGLVFGIFWFNSPTSKQMVRNVLRRYGNETLLSFSFANSTLSRLLDDLEAQQNMPDGGRRVLARRTIARQIELKNAVARGRFGEVWLGDWRGEKVAVKIFASRDEKSWARETEIYSTNMLRHNNVLRWIASDNKDTGTITELWLITEYLPHGSLSEYLENNYLTVSEGVQFIRSIAHGLAYLHTEVPGVNSNCYKPQIAHRDIKSRNILVKNDMTCAIADLGLAVRNIHGTLDIPDGRGGTVRYLAPEYLNNDLMPNRFVSFVNLDIYALSLVIWEITRRIDTSSGKKPPSAQLPFFEFVQREPTVDEMHQCVCVQKNRPGAVAEWEENKVTRELQRIMNECWTEHPSSRLTALNIRCSLDKLVEIESLKIMT